MRCRGFEKSKTKLAREKTFISCPFDLHQEYVLWVFCRISCLLVTVHVSLT